MELRAIRDFLNSTGTMEDFKRCYTAMMTEFVQKENFRPRPRSIIGVHILGAATEYFGLNPQVVVELMFTIPNAVASRQKNLPEFVTTPLETAFSHLPIVCIIISPSTRTG